MSTSLRTIGFALLLATSLLSACAQTPTAMEGATAGAPSSALQQVAAFDHQVTGVTVSKDGRIFVNFPRWTEDNEISVAEVKNGQAVPYPNAEWNAWRNVLKDKLSPANHFVSVQSVVADEWGNLWVLDPAAPGNERIVKGGPKLVKIDLATNAVTQVIPFDETVAPAGAYLNDVRFSKDGRFAYITDSGKGGIIVVDLQSTNARRLLDGHPAVLPEPGVAVKADGAPLRRPDGRAPAFASDGIALSADGEALYWQALTGKTLYRVPTAILNEPSLTPSAVAATVEKVGENGVADGLWIDPQNRMYVSAVEENAVKVRTDLNPGSPAPTTLVQDANLRWPDTFSQGPDGTLYVTASHIQDSPWFHPDAPPAVKTTLWKFSPPQ